MSRYPSQSRGRIVPVTELGYEIVPQQRGISSNHHYYFNRAYYHNIPIRHQFRNLVDHVVPMEIRQHNDLHNRYTPPVTPRTELMIDVLDEYLALNGVINCVYEKKTNEVYEIHEEQWQLIRESYKGV